MAEKTKKTDQKTKVTIVDDSFKIDADELIEELENIGDYKGIEEVKKDIEKAK